MDAESEKLLAHLLQTSRIASLGTSHDGAPFVSMVSVARADDGSAFYIHVSRLAQHTRDRKPTRASASCSRKRTMVAPTRRR